MRGVERVSDGRADTNQVVEGDGASRNAIAKGLAFEKFHGDEVLTVGFIDLVDGADVGVIEGGRGAGLTKEAFDHLGIAGELQGQAFEGDPAPEAGVFRAVDNAHASSTERIDELIVRNCRTDHRLPERKAYH